MNTDKIIAESIAKDYAPKESSKIVALKKLDNKAKLPATIFTYSFGIVSALVFGTGMCLAMQVIGSGFAGRVLGIVIGVIGIIACGVNYPIYKKMLEKKPFEYITISEICETAEVNRSTFYLHYENTGDLLKETTAYVLDNFASYFPVAAEHITAKFDKCDLQDLKFVDEKYLHPYLAFIRENQRMFLAVLSQPAVFDSKSIFQRMFDNIFKPILDRFHYPRDEQNYVMMFYLNGITAIITEWLKDGCQKSIEEISEVIGVCIYGRE